MATEIEKKYRLSAEQRDEVIGKLSEKGISASKNEFEVNTLFSGGTLKETYSILRLRRVDNAATLTFKHRSGFGSGIKHQREEESRVEDPEAIDAILRAVGFTPSLIYEKRRSTFPVEDVELVVDELPFGLYMEIEGNEDSIERIEKLLGLENLEVEHASYPQLTCSLGQKVEERFEARFPKSGIGPI
jgi:adenylate cyclase class 2